MRRAPASRFFTPRVLVALLSALCFCFGSQARAKKQHESPGPSVIRKSESVLRSEAINIVEPAYPPLARAAKVSGSVTVEVVVDEDGNVKTARAISGHSLLRASAVEAARQWKFKPTKLSGIAVKVAGNIVFDFNLGGAKSTHSAQSQDKNIVQLEKQAHDNPDSAEARYALGGAYYKAGDYNKAIIELKEAIRLDPKSADAYRELGRAYLKIDRYEEALEMFSKTVNIDPDYLESDEVYFAIGLINSKLGRFEEAANAFEASIKTSPDVLDSHLGLGIANFNLGKYEKAIESFKRIVEKDGSNVGGHFWLGRTYLRLGDKQSALKEYELLKPMDAEAADQLLTETKTK